MIEQGKYIYCIIGESEPENLYVTGISNQQVKALSYRDIAAMVSSAPIINFDRLDKEDLTKYVAIHQKVNQAITRETDVVPLTFGVIAPSASEVRRILARAYLQFKQALEEIEGKAEFAVQAWWDKQGLVSEILPINPETLRNACVKDIQDALGTVADRLALNKLIAQDMLANFSVLIKKTQEPALDAKMQELGGKYEGKLRFKYIGPMPPYSFSNINLSLGNFELVDSARKALGLAEEATWDEIRKAYHYLAHKYHPDKYEGAAQAHSRRQARDGQMNKITQAHGVLESYCRACDESPLAGRQGRGKIKRIYSFREEEVEDSIVIKGRS